MRSAHAIAIALALNCLISPISGAAFESGTDETRAGMCEDFDGLAFVFCVAMCEARECDRQPVGDDRCEVLAKGFSSMSTGAVAPCAPGRTPGSI